jgi:hypothetical protein
MVWISCCVEVALAAVSGRVMMFGVSVMGYVSSPMDSRNLE